MAEPIGKMGVGMGTAGLISQLDSGVCAGVVDSGADCDDGWGDGFEIGLTAGLTSKLDSGVDAGVLCGGAGCDDGGRRAGVR